MSAERSSSLSRKSSRQLQARVFLLDDSVHTFSINSCALGSELFIAIIEKQTILESDYFDLEYVNCEGVRCWIDHTKSIVKQVGNGKDLVFIFAVKFYTPHPNLLEEEYTRYLFALQIKRDIVSGQLICSTNTAALLASYIAQAEIGDFIEDDYIDNNYLRQLKLVNQPNDEVLNKIMEFHKTHIGISPSEADFHLLDTARKIEYYGVKMHLAKDHENLPLNLSVTHMGVVVFQNLTKINTFSWAKVRKLSFKRKKFLIKLHPEGYGYYKGMVEFYFETRDDCKRFWKKCIEHHSFFRCPASDKSQRKKPRVVTKGSSFRYCGRTQKELIEYVRENYSSKRDHFERPTKAKIVKSPHNGKRSRLGKSYHPFAIKSSYSAPSRAVSDSSELNRTGIIGSVSTHTPRQQRSVGGVTKPRWSHSAGQSPHEDSRDVKELNENKEVRNHKENKVVSNSTKIPQQKRSRKGRKFIQVSRTGSSADDDDDKRVTASEMSLSSSGKWETNVNGTVIEEDPLPAREAFRGTERLCRQRASIGGFGDGSDSDQGVSLTKEAERAKSKHMRQVSEIVSHKSDSPININELQDPPQKIVCIDQYRSRRPRNPDSLVRNVLPLVSAKRYKSTPNDVAGNSKLQSVDQVNNKELLSDISYVLLRRHKSPEQSRAAGSVKSACQSRRSLMTKSLKSVKDTAEDVREKETSFGEMRHSKSLDRRLIGIDGSTSHIITPKSPKLLREEYMQSQKRNVSDRATIEALKNQLRASSSLRNMGRTCADSSLRSQANGPMFVSAYRLPPVNNFSAKDDTMSPQTHDLDRIYGRISQRRKLNTDSTKNDNDDEVENNQRNKRMMRSLRQQSKSHTNDVAAEFSDSDDGQLRDTGNLESLLGVVPGNPIYLDSSSSSDDGEFDISPDRCSRPRSVSENEFKLRTPRSSRRSSICRGHNSSLSLTDSSFNSDASFQSDDDCDLSGSPYSFLADCSNNQHMSKNVKGSSGESSHLLDDDALCSQMKADEVNLQILEVPVLAEESPDEDIVERNPASEVCLSQQDSMSIDREESLSFTNRGTKAYSGSFSNASSSDQVMIVAVTHEPDATIVDQNIKNNDNVVIHSSNQSDTSFPRVLESLLQKRLKDSPFLRTSTPNKEYTVEDIYHIGSINQLHQDPIPMSYLLKSAISAPGLTRERVSPFIPLPAHLRRPFTSSSSSNTSSTSSMNMSEPTNPFLVTSSDHNQPDIITANNVPFINNQYEALFDKSMIPESLNRVVINNSFDLKDTNKELDRALVFLNEGAFSSISVGKSPTESGNADKFQETVEGNLMSYESSEYTSRPHSIHDEEPDEYVIPSDHRSFSPTSTSSSQQTSESGEFPGTKEPIISEPPIEERSESGSSTSEGSEEIEPFPPPPLQSDLLIFDERDEDIFKQMQQGDSIVDNDMCEELPQIDCTSPTADFPKPPPSILKDEFSSSEVPSLFAEDTVDSNTFQTDGSVIKRTNEIEIEDEIFPRFCSLLYDKDNKCDILSYNKRDTECKGSNYGHNNPNVGVKDESQKKIIPKYFPPYEEHNVKYKSNDKKNINNDKSDVGMNDSMPLTNNEELEMEYATIPRYYSIPYDEENEDDDFNTNEESAQKEMTRESVVLRGNAIIEGIEEKASNRSLWFDRADGECVIRRVSYEHNLSANDPLPCSFDLSDLTCQSPEETLEDGEC